MGLDLYIYVADSFKDIEKEKYIQEFYYRKVNWLLGFMRKNLLGLIEAKDFDSTNLVYYQLDKEVIKKLIDECDTVLKYENRDTNKAIELAKKHLPTCEGFFFGSQEYDEDYFESIKRVKKDMKWIYDKMEMIPDLAVYFQAWW